MKLPFSTPPAQLCILRLSAIGDICHTLPVVRTIQRAWPETRLTWIIGKTEYALLKGIDDIEFIVFDKARGFRAYLDVARSLKGKRFDALLHMQMSLRSSLISTLVRTPIKLGFDRARARDMQWLFTSHAIAPMARQHVMDSLFGFSQALGIDEREIIWDIPISAEDQQQAKQQASADKYIVISPCSSMAYRNWSVAGYAALADYAAEKYGMHVYLTGGNSVIEHQLADAIMQQSITHNISNLTGKTSLKQLLAIIKNARCLISPDSGPAHMATAVATPVIGLYACTNPDRARPYLSTHWTINQYPQAVENSYHKPIAELPWGIRVRDPGTMELISADQVKNMLDKLINETS